VPIKVHFLLQHVEFWRTRGKKGSVRFPCRQDMRSVWFSSIGHNSSRPAGAFRCGPFWFRQCNASKEDTTLLNSPGGLGKRYLTYELSNLQTLKSKKCDCGVVIRHSTVAWV
jgi:hypothetical protein